MLQPLTYPRTKFSALPGICYPLQNIPGMQLGTRFDFLTAPFEALRFQYASAVKAGVVQRSILASGQLEQAIDRLEKLILGPLARQR